MPAESHYRPRHSARDVLKEAGEPMVERRSIAASKSTWRLATSLVLVGMLLLPAGRALATIAVGSTDSATPSPYPGGRWTPPPATYGVVAVRNVMIPMDDKDATGNPVKLVGDVYYPADASGAR